jgi:hypothetical protein
MNIDSLIQAALKGSLPIRQLSTPELAREIAALRAIEELLVPCAPTARAPALSEASQELRSTLALRLQLCETERVVRSRSSRAGRKSASLASVARSTPRGPWVAKDVQFDRPPLEATGPVNAKPNGPGNYLRLLDPRT